MDQCDTDEAVLEGMLAFNCMHCAGSIFTSMLVPFIILSEFCLTCARMVLNGVLLWHP